MRIHFSLVDHDGRSVHEASVESTVISLGPSEPAMFHHDALPWMEIHQNGSHATLYVGKRPHPLKRQNVIPLPGDRYALRVDLYLRPEAVPRVRGRCPTCAEALTDHQVGGAYRSVARQERRCGHCETAVVALRDAPEVLRRFDDRSPGDWFHVTVSSRCPDCLEPMERAVFHADRAEVEVERCKRCGLVVLDAEDQARLA